MQTQEILVLVHPGSACGSASYNIGHPAARSARDLLVAELRSWTGGVCVIDGDLSDELGEYPEYEQAIDKALQQAAARGMLSRRVVGNDGSKNNQEFRAEELVRDLAYVGIDPKGIAFTVSGAWYHPDGEHGCVNSVIDALKAAGCNAAVSDCAVHFEEPEDEGEGEAAGMSERLAAVFKGG